MNNYDEQEKSSSIEISRFSKIPISDYVDIILLCTEESDEAMYELLHNRLMKQLYKLYDVYHNLLYDDFEDIVDDFFLYLREGKIGNSPYPYHSLRRIKKKESFESWILNTFRNYLNGRANAEAQVTSVRLCDDLPSICDDNSSPLTDERKLIIASQLIAYAHQVFYPRGRFVFLRSLLTMLNKQQALPDEEMASALQMTYLSYRVMVHRIKYNLTKFRNRLQHGELFRLDEQHQQMNHHINENFTKLYPILLTYYTETIDTLKCADAIHKLRQQYFEDTGMMLHEPDMIYPVTITPAAFWEKMNRMLIS